MRYDVNPKHVMGTIVEVDRVLQGKGFNQVEVMLGLQELVGRLIVEMAKTPVGADEFSTLCKEHLDSTLRVGLQAKSEPIIAQA